MLSKKSLTTLCWMCFAWPAMGHTQTSTQALTACPQVSLPASLNSDYSSVAPSIIQSAMKATLSIETPSDSDELSDESDTQQLGSGVMVSPTGYILTNAHVVGARSKFTVTLSDGRTKHATLIGLDRLVDIALLRIEPRPGPQEQFAFLRLKLSQAPMIGEPVVALGFPMNFGLSATRGIVSGLGRAYDGVWPVDFLQHDAALNPGNSGGPLIDAQGCLLGLNTATPLETQFDIGVGLAIPADLIGEIVPQLLTIGRFPRGHLGIYVSNADQTIARALRAGQTGGLIVDEMDITAHAAQAGLIQGDIITHLDGRPLRQVRDLTRYLLRRSQGEAIQLRINRSGQVLTIRVALGDTPLRQEAKPEIRQPETPTSPETRGDLGFEVLANSPQAIIQAITSEGIADHAGLQVGDAILALNGIPVTGSNQVESMLSQIIGTHAQSVIVLRIGRPDMGTRHIALRLNTRPLRLGLGSSPQPDIQNLPYGPV